jgi:hypothetical protein
LIDNFALAATEGRKVLIYYEGHLVKNGTSKKYRSGV